jgi:signal transduction histidine kinase
MRPALLHQPTTIFSLLAVVGLLITAFFAVVAANKPGASIEARYGPGNSITINGMIVPTDEGLVRFTDRTGSVRLEMPVWELVGDQEPRGTPAENRVFFEHRNKSAKLLEEDGVTLRLPDGRTLPAFAISPAGFHLSTDSWVAISVGFLALLGGLWVLVLRPRELAAQMVALSGVALWVASLTIILIVRGNPATTGSDMQIQLHINHISALVFGGALVTIFCVYPLQIVPRIFPVLLGGVFLAVAVIEVLEPWPHTFVIVLVVLISSVVMMFPLVVAQAIKARRDPAHRTVVAWIGTALVLSSGLFTAVNFLPLLMGSPPIVGDSIAMAAFLLFYFAIAVAITRYRMFDLGNWTVYVIRAVLVMLVVLVADMALVYWAGERWTLSVAVLLVALAWMPIRAWLMRLADRRRDTGNMQLIRGANEVAFALHPADQRASWKEALVTQFDPLEVHSIDTQTAEIRDDGRLLAIPSPLGGAGLALGYAGQGKRLFDSHDLEMAKVLHRLVEEMIGARQAYDQGVREERLRIARDLHDDVGARLLTGLHMADQRLRPTLQAAMSDIRAIVGGMTGEQVSLERLLSEMRHETARRTEASGIHLDWPLSEHDPEEYLLDYRQQKALTSAFRESVSNVIRHARAARLKVRIAANAGLLEISIEDDGIGMPVSASAPETQGYGLRNLTRRMTEVGGSMQIKSAPGGTEIQLSLPLTYVDIPTPTKQGVTGIQDDLSFLA